MQSRTVVKVRDSKPSADVSAALVEMQRIAMQGIEKSDTLTPEDVSKMCRLAYVKLAERSLKE